MTSFVGLAIGGTGVFRALTTFNKAVLKMSSDSQLLGNNDTKWHLISRITGHALHFISLFFVGFASVNFGTRMINLGGKTTFLSALIEGATIVIPPLGIALGTMSVGAILHDLGISHLSRN